MTLDGGEGGFIILNNKALCTTETMLPLSKTRNTGALYLVTLKNIHQEVTKYGITSQFPNYQSTVLVHTKLLVIIQKHILHAMLTSIRKIISIDALKLK